MAYAGAAYRIPCGGGGSYYSADYESTPPEAMVTPSKNLNLHIGGRTKRGGTTPYNSTAVTGTPKILGGYDYRKEDGTRFIMARGNDGVLYKDVTSSASIKTGLSASTMPCFETFADELYVTDGENTPQTWNGVAAGTSNLTTPATDWSGSVQPRYCLAHGAGASRRMWYFGVPGKLKYAYYSILDNGKDMTGAGSGQIKIETSDGFGIVGGREFGQRLMLMGKRKAYIIDDSDPSVANWGYVAAQWEGGVAHHNLMVKTPNDLICMQEDGEIYSVTAVQSYGDYKAASIARPAFIHQWIADNVNLALIDQFHAIYDPNLRAIKFFVIRNGQSQIDSSLVFFIDRQPSEAWMLHDNLTSASGYRAASSFLVRTSIGKYEVYTGDYSGKIWKTEQSAKNDNSSGYDCRFRTPPLPFDNPRVKKKYRRGFLVFGDRGNYNVNVRWWVDNVQQTTRVVSTSGSTAAYDSGIYDSSVFGGAAISDAKFDLGAIGKRIQLEIENSVADQDFFISEVIIDNEVLGARAA
jgi:hypothetical protein